jgi:hypothetical protein
MAVSLVGDSDSRIGHFFRLLCALARGSAPRDGALQKPLSDALFSKLVPLAGPADRRRRSLRRKTPMSDFLRERFLSRVEPSYRLFEA